MKIRNGFVSNSSSSSFILHIKDEKLTQEERKNKTFEAYIKAYGEDTVKEMEDDNRWLSKEIEKLEENKKYIALIQRIEWGGEEAINKILPVILETLGIDKNKIDYEWGE